MPYGKSWPFCLSLNVLKLDESVARRHLKSLWSLSGRSLHLTLVTKRSRLHLTLKIQMSRSWPRSNPLVTFVAWSSIDMFAFCSVANWDHFWLRYSKFHIWPWKFKVKVMTKVTSDGHIWSLGFNRYVCFSFCGNRTIFGRDMGNSIFDLEISRSRPWPRSNLVVAFEALRSIGIFAFRFMAIWPFLAEI